MASECASLLLDVSAALFHDLIAPFSSPVMNMFENLGALMAVMEAVLLSLSLYFSILKVDMSYIPISPSVQPIYDLVECGRD